ncbi:MAG: LicD family protein [Lachnospiraceae bacterium]|nr:LicD family protein [Lachnospiraceae bacterium]
MEHSTSFYKDEIRNGFYIPTAIKQAWANTLDILSEIDRICAKYRITYFADWGTILGAVRHGGFIPWDDDLDICMKRDDYIRFREVADNELPENYCIHDYERHENHWLFLARVVNNDKMCFDPAYLNEHYNFPWLAGIDIFLKDYLYDDSEDETARDREILEILACADGIIDKTISRETALSAAKVLFNRYGIKMPQNSDYRSMAVSLYRLAEQQMGRVPSSASTKIGQIFPWVLKSGLSAGEPKADYTQTIRLPFEDTTIPVPLCYNRVLSRRYGNYCQIRKVWGGHDYPYFEAQKREIEQLSGSTYPTFTFKEDMLIRPEKDESNSLKSISTECLAGLEDYLNAIRITLDEENFESLEDLFRNSLQLSEDFGTLIEQTKGAYRQPVREIIPILEEYCASLTEFYQKMGQDGVISDFDTLLNSLEQVKSIVRNNITVRKEILFLTTGPAEWKSLKPLYEDALKEENTDVYVLILPLMVKDVFGNIVNSDTPELMVSTTTGYEALNIEHVVDYADYDPVLHAPDRAYIQFPYDDENPYLTIPSQFYSAELRKYTDELICVPIGNTSEFSEQDTTDQYTLRCHVYAAGTIYSDTVYVQSDNMKNQYVNALCTFAGKDTEDVWNRKIMVNPYSNDESDTNDSKKRILYCIGLNELSENPNIFIDAVKKRLCIFDNAGEEIRVSIALYPSDHSEWEKINASEAAELFSILDHLARDDKATLIEAIPSNADDTAGDFDAYYGSPSPFVPAFTVQHKPVMISDYSI